MKRSGMRILALLIVLAASAGAVHAQHVEELYSPYFLGLGPHTSLLDAPLATELNPAAAGLEQRIRLELNYLALMGSTANPGWGNALNLGLTLPTNVGVFSFAGYYMGSSATMRPYLGNIGSLTVSFSKDLLPNLLVGAGVMGMVGEQGGITDWGLGLNLGMTWIPGKVLFMEDAAVGVAMRTIGKGFYPAVAVPPVTDSFPAAFTPAASVSAKLVKTDPFTLGVYADVSAPTFSNVLFYGGLDVDILHFIIARASYRLDLRELIDPAVDRFPAAFGVSVNFRIDLEKNVQFMAERGWSKNDIRFDVALAPLADGAYGAGLGLNMALGMKDEKPPQVTVNPVRPETQSKEDTAVYVSPNLDGKQDSLELPLSITDERYVTGYRLVIKDQKGNVVRTIENKETRPENLDMDNVLNRLTYVKSGIQIPPSISWDGKNDTGTIVPDGAYTYSLEAWDDNGNKTVTEPQKVVIDATPPKPEVKASYTVFSPNGDGNKDALPLQLSGSEEDAWKAEVRDAKGQIVAAFDWKGKPQDMAWDGKTNSGALLPDGVYSIALSSTDRAGNSAARKFDNIIINTKATPVFITVDTEIFSPNGDGIMDGVSFDVVIGIPEGIKSWTLEMLNEKNEAERTFKGAMAPAARMGWDGKKDDGSRASEGMFSARMTVEYDKGDKPVALTRVFRLDVSAPKTEIELSPEPFSPDNDGVEDELLITTKVSDPSEVASWSMEITDPMGKHFTSFKGEGTPSEAIIWDGISDKGELVQAASDYKLTMTIQDTVGNKATLSKTIMVDVLVMRDGDKLYIRVPSITFKPDTADYKAVAKEALEKNLWTIQRLALIFKKYRTYQIQIEGHAVSVYWKDQARSEKEQVEELIPLSIKRAEAIKAALVAGGIDASRISTVGIGASRPLFPFSDEENLWKNRRVEFILIKK